MTWAAGSISRGGNVLKCLCRVRTTPEILNGQVVTAVEVWTVLDTATKAQRGVYTKAEKDGARPP